MFKQMQFYVIAKCYPSYGRKIQHIPSPADNASFYRVLPTAGGQSKYYHFSFLFFLFLKKKEMTQKQTTRDGI